MRVPIHLIYVVFRGFNGKGPAPYILPANEMQDIVISIRILRRWKRFLCLTCLLFTIIIGPE
jgi:hypothetical protein